MIYGRRGANEAEYGKALDANKVVLAQQVMLGGTLGPRRGTGK